MSSMGVCCSLEAGQVKFERENKMFGQVYIAPTVLELFCLVFVLPIMRRLVLSTGGVGCDIV